MKKNESAKEKGRNENFSNLDKIIQKSFKDMVDLSKVDTSVKQWYDTGVYALNYIMSKNLFGGIPSGRVTAFDGKSGCLSGDTKILISRGKRAGSREYTLEDLFKKFNGGNVGGHRVWDRTLDTRTFSYLEEEDSIRQNRIRNIYKQGEQETWVVKTENGLEIRATSDHPFKALSENGRGDKNKDNFVHLSDLALGDKIMFRDLSYEEPRTGRKTGRKETYGVKFHPYAWDKIVGEYTYKRIHTARLVYEANMNNIDFDKFIDMLKNDEEKSRKFKFLSPEFVVHHKDGDNKNDAVDNLEALTKIEHDKLHAKASSSYKKLNNNGYGYTEVVSIEYYGKEMTYDIEMDTDNKNYVANGLVVHNTGKSLLSSSAMRDPNVDMIILIDVEGGGHGKELIEFAGVDPKKVRRIVANTFTSYKVLKSSGKIEEIKDTDLPSGKLETDKYIYVEGLTSKIRRFIQSVTLNKIDANIFIVLDSLANVQSVRALSGTQDVGKRVQDINQFFKNFDVEFEKSDITFVFTNKLYQAIDGSGRLIANGGESAVYNPSLTVRFRDITESDDLTSKNVTDEKASKSSAIGRTIKPIRARVVKSRFGTEYRNITFLIDMGYGPIKLSGLFELCYDFGVIKKSGGAYYSLPGIFEKKFYKKDFISMVRENEAEILKQIQKKLEEVEVKLKEERTNFQANDIKEVDQTSLSTDIKDEDEETQIEKEEEFSEIKKAMIKEKE